MQVFLGKHKLLLSGFFIFFLNLFYKLYFNIDVSFWYDEIISVQSAHLDLGHIKHVSEWDKNPPFYYYVLSVWIKIFNDSETVVRLLSILINCFSGLVLFIWLNKHINYKVGVFASLLFIFNPILFSYSFEARAYSLLVLLVLISSYLYFELLKKPKIFLILSLGLINFLIAYTHYIAILTIVAQFVLIWFVDKRETKKYFVFSNLVTLILIVFRFTYKQILVVIGYKNDSDYFWLSKPTLNNLNEFFSGILGNAFLFYSVLIVLILLVFLILKRRIIIDVKSGYFIFMSFGITFFLFFISQLKPLFLDRYLLFTLPIYLAIIAFFTSEISNRNISFFLILVVTGFSAYYVNYDIRKNMNYKEAVGFLKTQKITEHDLIIVKTKDIKPLFSYYYHDDYFYNVAKYDSLNTNVFFCNDLSDVSEEAIIKSFRVYMLDSFEDFNSANEEFNNKLYILKPNYVSTKYYKGVTITVLN